MTEGEGIPLIEPVLGDEELEMVKQVMDSGFLTQGPITEEFEEGFAARVGADHAITATSCTTGLELALEAFGIGTGDEVIVPDFTFPATANAVRRVDATPILVDVDRETYNINVDIARTAISEDTAAIIPVSWGGQPLRTKPLNSIADDHNVAIIEDAACSSGSEYDGEAVGSQFDVSVFSFHPRKIMTTGEGGMITTDDDELAETIRSIKNFGTDQREDEIGFVRADATNLRFSDVLSAIGVAQLEKLDDIVARRRELAYRYTDLLTDVERIDPPTEIAGAYHNFQTYAAYVEAGDDATRDALIEYLGQQNIETQIGTHALHRTEAFADAECVSDLKTSAALEDNLLTLPLCHDMTEDDQCRVVDELDGALAAYR